MSVNRCFLLISILFFAGILPARNQYEKTYYTHWSNTQVDSILNDSPWTTLLFAGSQLSGSGMELSGADRFFFRIRFLTAKPVREALLRQISLYDGLTVSLEQLRNGTWLQDRIINEFVASRPDDVRASGDSQYIVLSVTILSITRQNCEELDDAASLSSSNIGQLGSNAVLITDTGKQVSLAQYRPPGPDRLGAKLYFPRNLPDGRPLIAPGDRRLRFESWVNKERAVIEFDLKKMQYEGKLEL
jgi:hypothetical protein